MQAEVSSVSVVKGEDEESEKEKEEDEEEREKNEEVKGGTVREFLTFFYTT